MNALALIESSVETIEPGSPVHDAVYNFVSSARKNYNNTDGHELLGFIERIGDILTSFTRLSEEHQWTVEDDIAHAITSITQSL